MPSSRHRLVAVVVCGILGALVGLAFAPVFGGFPRQFVVSILVTAGVGTVVAVGAALLPRVPAALSVVVGTLLVAGTAWLVVAPEGDVLDGPWLLLTGALPADPSGPGLTAIAAVAGWLSLVGGVLAATAHGPLVPLVPSVVGFTAALGVGASGTRLPQWFGAVTVVAVVAVVLTGSSRPPSRGMLLGAAIVAAVATTAAVVLAPLVPAAARPADARALVDAPVFPRTGISPLQQFPAWRAGDLRLRFDGTTSERVDRLRMATLDRFDGTYWTTSADYRRAGTTLPKGTDISPAGTRTIGETVNLTTPGELAWLPTPGRAGHLDIGGLGVDEASGDVIVPTDRSVPRGYTATSTLPLLTADRIRAGTPTTGPGPAKPLPAELAGFASSRTAQSPGGAAGLLALLSAFTGPNTEFRYDRSERPASGHGLFQIGNLLTQHVGTEEQFASGFAVLARSLGYDARVVLGFRPRYQGEHSFTVTEADVDAWVEVHFDDLGWVPFDPTPRAHPVGQREDASPPPPPSQQDASQQAAQEQIQQPVAPAPAPVSPPPADPTPRPSPWPVVLLGCGALIILLLLAIPAAKLWRGRCRRRGFVVLGAWHQVVDRLREVGIPVAASMTRSEIVAGTAAALPGAWNDLANLARWADAATYSPEGAHHDGVWKAGRTLRRRLSRCAPWPRRALLWFDPRPLR
ncbi:DUF3488 and transglutaminase-like domain-containing protein [Actinokineospora enzanensis]|uniref:DUF3488 and transglutaminase-like domain-containing protein n=1 Tax=Actinokineospora enzanensis TaxID=155975 RepID=UPI00037ECF4A|nr:transglutaminaseTgpA domain-containing protein [Actinokineospora enzanensis]